MTETTNVAPIIGRNEPCPCRSGKKYKRCCGANAAPKITPPKAPSGGIPGGFDPSSMGNFDPQMMMQMSQALQRLPKGQLQRLQSLMQKAMGGKDVSAEAAEFEKGLPPDFQNMMMSFAGQMAATGSPDAASQVMPALEAPSAPEMSVDQAKDVIARAVSEGKLSKDQADQLLSVSGPAANLSAPPSLADSSASDSSKIGKFWGKIVGKKDGSSS